jgi:hypothetical protein
MPGGLSWTNEEDAPPPLEKPPLCVPQVRRGPTLIVCGPSLRPAPRPTGGLPSPVSPRESAPGPWSTTVPHEPGPGQGVGACPARAPRVHALGPRRGQVSPARSARRRRTRSRCSSRLASNSRMRSRRRAAGIQQTRATRRRWLRRSCQAERRVAYRSAPTHRAPPAVPDTRLTSADRNHPLRCGRSRTTGFLVETDHVACGIAKSCCHLGSVGTDRLHELSTLGNDSVNGRSQHWRP